MEPNVSPPPQTYNGHAISTSHLPQSTNQERYHPPKSWGGGAEVEGEIVCPHRKKPTLSETQNRLVLNS